MPGDQSWSAECKIQKRGGGRGAGELISPGSGGWGAGTVWDPPPRRAAHAPDAPPTCMHSGELEIGIYPLPTAPDFAGQTGDAGGQALSGRRGVMLGAATEAGWCGPQCCRDLSGPSGAHGPWFCGLGDRPLGAPPAPVLCPCLGPFWELPTMPPAISIPAYINHCWFLTARDAPATSVRQ